MSGKALIPANRSAAYRGIRKYSPAINRITQRQTGKLRLRLAGRAAGAGVCGGLDARYRSHFAALR